MSERMDFADGKYTVINDNGVLTALRHGEPWGRDLTGDNLVYWMFVEAIELKRQRDEMQTALNAAKRLFDEALPKFNWGASALDANAIRLLNEVPRVVQEAIAKVEGGAA